MQILPVLDLKDGQVVRGVAGRRAEYHPVVSRLTSSAEPVAVARAFREHFGLSELYVADLNAIAGEPPAWNVHAELRDLGFRLWVDAGVRDLAQAAPLADRVDVVVAGLETISGPEELGNIVRQIGPDRLAFSLDLKHGRPLGNTATWDREDASAIAERAAAAGVRRLIVLDLARVGVGAGIGTEDFCRAFAAKHPEIMVIAGGGIRGPDDICMLKSCGIAAVLVASALHDGRIRREDLNLF